MDEINVPYKIKHYFQYRETVCWNCHTPINNGDYPECPACTWIICPTCGACEQNGCFGVLKGSKKEYEDFRRKWFEFPVEDRPDVGTWLKDVAKAERLEKENAEKAEIQRIEAMWETVKHETIVLSDAFGIGHIHSSWGEGKDRRFKVSFNTEGNAEKVIPYVFPDAFEEGFLRFPE